MRHHPPPPPATSPPRRHRQYQTSFFPPPPFFFLSLEFFFLTFYSSFRIYVSFIMHGQVRLCLPFYFASYHYLRSPLLPIDKLLYILFSSNPCLFVSCFIYTATCGYADTCLPHAYSTRYSIIMSVLLPHHDTSRTYADGPL
jgi:hypothetical protein